MWLCDLWLAGRGKCVPLLWSCASSFCASLFAHLCALDQRVWPCSTVVLWFECGWPTGRAVQCIHLWFGQLADHTGASTASCSLGSGLWLFSHVCASLQWWYCVLGGQCSESAGYHKLCAASKCQCAAGGTALCCHSIGIWFNTHVCCAEHRRGGLLGLQH